MTETNQGKTKTATEFFREKFADEEETEPIWIDPKGGNADGEREAKP
jgi:hypothetical protein